MVTKPAVVCLTATRNEDWILERFLKATSLWADYIIIADQMSTDKSREIALKFSKVRLIDNKSTDFNEPERQAMLIKESRKIPGKKLLITLDADEMFTPEIFTSKQWSDVLLSKEGTIINFQWANFAPDLKHYWLGYFFPWGYMDDGSECFGTNSIHNARIPMPDGHEQITITDFKVIHFQYTDWERMKSKHRYYQCFELVNFPLKNSIDIYRQYHHMDLIHNNDMILIPNSWIDYYKDKDIDILHVNSSENFWYDDEVIKMMNQYGCRYFSRIDIWSVDWSKKGINSRLIVKPKKQKFLDFLLIEWCKYSQDKRDKKIVRRIDRLAKFFFDKK